MVDQGWEADRSTGRLALALGTKVGVPDFQFYIHLSRQASQQFWQYIPTNKIQGCFKIQYVVGIDQSESLS